MSKSRYIRDEIWSDSWFFGLNNDEKVLWFFLLTNDRNNVAGIYKLSPVWGQAVTRFTNKQFESILKRFEKDQKIFRDEDWVVIINHVKHQSLNPSVVEGIKRVCSAIPYEVGYRLSQAVPGCPTLLYFTLPNLGAAEAAKENMPWKKYNENDHSEDTPSIDIETGEQSLPKGKKKEKKVPDEVQQVFDLFDNPAKAIWRLREIEREAAKALFDTYGIEKLEIRMARIKKEKNNKDPMFPLVTTPSQLLDKMPNVERYLNL